MNEAHVPSQMARPGSPFRAMGKPSNIVATDDGLPGMPSRMEVTRPARLAAHVHARHGGQPREGIEPER